MKVHNAWNDIPSTIGPAIRELDAPRPDPIAEFERIRHEPMGVAPVQQPDESDHTFRARVSGTPDCVSIALNARTPGWDTEEPSTVPSYFMSPQLEGVVMMSPYFRD